jgi:hypothetical protein
MELVKEEEKQETGVLGLRLPVEVIKRHRAIEARAKKLRVKLAATIVKHYPALLDEIENDLNNMNVAKLRKAEE